MILKSDKPTATKVASKSNLSHWVALINEQFRKKDFKHAHDIILQALTHFPNHPHLLDRLFIVDQRWHSSISGNKIHLITAKERDFNFIQQCYANEDFMNLFLPMGRKNQNPESILSALKNNAFSVARFKSVHWVIHKEIQETTTQQVLTDNLKPIGLVTLADIQIAHRRAEVLVGIPNPEDRKQAAAVIATLLVFDFAFNQIGLQKLTSLVIANNPHSQRSAESIGFNREGLRRQHLRDPKTRLWLDCYENGLIEEDFRESKVIARLSERLLGRNIV